MVWRSTFRERGPDRPDSEVTVLVPHDSVDAILLPVTEGMRDRTDPLSTAVDGLVRGPGEKSRCNILCSRLLLLSISLNCCFTYSTVKRILSGNVTSVPTLKIDHVVSLVAG
ncbi:unnamed protein product [Lasius platythorax]|uniref:Uncharacterized protein n=1 Tax=Lasius platythorax TaxID=488582 RepID=A0AAV2MW49_9HYME